MTKPNTLFYEGLPVYQGFGPAQLDELLTYWLERDLTDLIITPQQSPWVRVNGTFIKASPQTISTRETGELLTHLTNNEAAWAIVSSGQDLDFAYEIGEKGLKKRFRCNATAVSLGRTTAVTLALRSIRGEPPMLRHLNIEPPLLKALFPRDGLVLVTGVMGSGKSTLIASALRNLAESGGRHIATFESPVEFNLTNPLNLGGPVEQTEIPGQLASFALAAKNAARRAADVVFLGESRDRATLKGLVEAAGLGVAAYTTAHTRGVAETPLHLINLFEPNERQALAAELISVLKVIVQQRLFPKIGGGRLAVREYLILDRESRQGLLKLPITQLEDALNKLLAEKGQSLLDVVAQKTAEGLLSPVILKTLQSERGLN
jgi:defect-in-organelle-trafficking protein DotB